MSGAPPELKAAVVADYAAGMSTSAVARKHDVPPSTVYRWVSAAGVSRSLTQIRRTGCDVEGCDRPHRAHGYCGPHNLRLQRYGDPTHGVINIVDTEARLEDIAWMAETGECLTGAAQRMDLTVIALARWLERNNPALLTRLIGQEPRDHNRRPDQGISISALTGRGERIKRRKRNAGVAA